MAQQPSRAGRDRASDEYGSAQVRPVGSKYLLEESLGRGATGTVFRGRVRDDAAVPGLEQGQAVAIKVLREELAADPDVVMRFLRERSVLLRLSHPNIVRTRDLVVEGELLALVMDLVEGPDLFRYLRSNGPLSPIAGSLLMAQVADALAASHADGIVHRDLKPANVLLATSEVDGAERMYPMLTDFGIARLADSPGITRTHEFVGTPAYVAPESADGRPQTAAVDVYGAGIMLYELTTGRPPFQGDGPLAILQAHLAQEPERPRTMPEPLWTVIERCLRKDPAERPTAVSLAQALRVVAAGVGVHAAPAAVDAALAVGELLVPDRTLAAQPTAHATAAAFGGYDPSAATQVMSHAPAGAEDRTQLLQQPPAAGAEDRTQLLQQPPVMPPADGRTAVLPPMPAGPPAAQPEAPHPWQTQLRAARDRNQQTEIGYLDPEELGRPQVAPQPYQAPRPGRPQGGPGQGQGGPGQGRPGQPAGYGQQPPAGPGYPQGYGGQGARPGQPQGYQQTPGGAGPQGYGRPPAGPAQGNRSGQPQGYPPPAPGAPQGYGQQPPRGPQGQQPAGGRPPVAPPPYQGQQPHGAAPQGYPPPGAPQRRSEPPAPRQREPEPAREPRRRSRNRMYIPGLGCLKGCLMVLLILAVGALALWNYTPLPEWWQQVQDWFGAVNDWVSSFSESSN